jgi:hypothetical protein
MDRLKELGSSDRKISESEFVDEDEASDVDRELENGVDRGAGLGAAIVAEGAISGVSWHGVCASIDSLCQ